jgi:hypothetical protein
MARSFAGKAIDDVLVVDDNSRARDTAAMTISDACLHPIKADGPLPPLKKFVQQTRRTADAAYCDHNLQTGQYAPFEGAAAVAALYKIKFPAVLCTRFTKADIEHIRPHLRYIPSLLSPETVGPETLADALEVCVGEFKNVFRTTRRPWRTLVRVEALNHSNSGKRMLDLVVPAWKSDEVVRVSAEVFKGVIRDEQLTPGFRFYAEVNLGAETPEQIFFEPLP